MRTRTFLILIVLGLLPFHVSAQATCTITTSQTVNLRTGPGTNFAIAEQIGGGTQLTAEAQTTDSQNFVWLYLSNDAWVRSDVVNAPNSCADLPRFGVEPTPQPVATFGPVESVSTYSEADLEEIRNNSNTIVLEDFSSPDHSWSEYNETVENGNLLGTARNGVYMLQHRNPPRASFFVIPSKENPTLNVTDSFEASIEIGPFQTSAPNWEITLGYREPIGDGYYWATSYNLRGDGTWELFAFNMVEGQLPQNINLADGATHRFSVLFEEVGNNVNATLTIDNQLIDSQILPYEVSSREDLNQFYSQVVGEVYFRIAFRGTETVETTATIILDNFVVRQFEREGLVSGAGLGALTEEFRSDITRLTFRYPEGWYLLGHRPFNDRSILNAAIYNISMANSPGGFAGAENELGFTLYEPVQVMERARLTDTQSAELNDVLEAFIQNNDGDAVWGNISQPKSIQLGDDRPASQATIAEDGRDRMWLAFRSSDDSVTIMEIYTSSGQLEELSPKVIEIAATVDYPLPDQNLEDHEEILRKYLITANSGLPGQALELMCSADRLGIGLFSAIFNEVGGFAGSLGFAPVYDLDVVVFSANADGRYFETISLEDGVALVRVMGLLRLTYPTGERDLIRNDEFFSGDGFGLFSTDVFRMAQHEDGYWEVCPGRFE